MIERKLFSSIDAREIERPFPIRPLGPLSDLVVEEMPKQLESVRLNGGNVLALSNAGESLLSSLSASQWSEIEADPKQRDLALLDLIYLQTGISSSGTTPGNHLTEK